MSATREREAVTFRQESPYYYAVISGGAVVGYTYSHPRCLPRSWSVRLADGDSPWSGTEVRDWFPTRKRAGLYLAALARACEACGSAPGEACRWDCLGYAHTFRP